MVTKDELYGAVRGLMHLNLNLQLRVIALQKTLESQKQMSPGWIELQIQDLETQDQILQARAAIEALGPLQSGKSLEDILRDFQGPIQ